MEVPVQHAQQPAAVGESESILGFPLYPPFALNAPRFSQETFLGRWLHFNDMIDPRTLLVSNKKLEECVKLLNDYKTGALRRHVTDRELWEAQKIKQATIHPDTGEKIFMPFRMSGYVPFGSPIVVGLLLPGPTLASTVFWQWLNQSHNACVNYANRNATKATPTSKFVQGYLTAVGTAVSIALGLNLLLKRAERFAPATKMVVQKFIPFPAVSLASTCNVLFMRWHERNQGVEVFDSTGKAVGTSKIAAKRALRDTAITRAFLPAPIFVIPPVVMTMLERMRFLQKRPWLHLPINAVLGTLSFGVALPIAIALFPQVSKISVADMEPEFKVLTTETELVYNKGL